MFKEIHKSVRAGYQPSGVGGGLNAVRTRLTPIKREARGQRGTVRRYNSSVQLPGPPTHPPASAINRTDAYLF